ncbi:hypothetical protein EDB89DRAFT_1910680 [Lactarius sanguifluus]|nr:hypothetical protein EDB89DRAFT_1910680 [Lactarius sanguifluus]
MWRGEMVVTPTNEDPPRPSSPTEFSVSPRYKLGQVLALNLSRNRLYSLFGLERLVALERVDVGHNQEEESGEVGRLSLLPNITEVWVAGNALTEIERGKVDPSGWTPAGFYERRSLTSPPPEQMSSTRPMSKAYSPPVVPVGGAATATTAPAVAAAAPTPSTTAVAPAASSSPAFSPAPSSHQQSPLLPATSAKPRKKRAKRIVHLDADPANANAAGMWVTVSEEPSEHVGPPTSASRSPLGAPASLPPHPRRLLSHRSIARRRRRRTLSRPSTAAGVGGLWPAVTSAGAPAARSHDERARVGSAAPGKVEDGVGEEIKEEDAFRARVEALRSEMGDGWLKRWSGDGEGAMVAGTALEFYQALTEVPKKQAVLCAARPGASACCEPYHLAQLPPNLPTIVYKMPAVSFQAILDKALADYSDQIGVELDRHPFADQLRGRDSPDDILKLLEDKANAFRPSCPVIHTLSGVLGETVPFQPAKAIFVGMDVLITAADGVSSSYDALVELFECLANFLKRLRIYTDVPLTPLMADIIGKIMVELLSVFALATKQIRQGRFKICKEAARRERDRGCATEA